MKFFNSFVFTLLCVQLLKRRFDVCHKLINPAPSRFSSPSLIGLSTTSSNFCFNLWFCYIFCNYCQSFKIQDYEKVFHCHSISVRLDSVFLLNVLYCECRTFDLIFPGMITTEFSKPHLPDCNYNGTEYPCYLSSFSLVSATVFWTEK